MLAKTSPYGAPALSRALPEPRRRDTGHPVGEPVGRDVRPRRPLSPGDRCPRRPPAPARPRPPPSPARRSRRRCPRRAGRRNPRAPAGRAPAGSPGSSRDARSRRPAPPRSPARCGWPRRRARSWLPKTTKRPASTGVSSARTCATQSRSSTRATAKSGAPCSRASSASPARSGRAVEEPADVPQPRAVVVVVHLARHRRRIEAVERVAQRAGGGLALEGGRGAVERAWAASGLAARAYAQARHAVNRLLLGQHAPRRSPPICGPADKSRRAAPRLGRSRPGSGSWNAWSGASAAGSAEAAGAAAPPVRAVM